MHYMFPCVRRFVLHPYYTGTVLVHAWACVCKILQHVSYTVPGCSFTINLHPDLRPQACAVVTILHTTNRSVTCTHTTPCTALPSVCSTSAPPGMYVPAKVHHLTCASILSIFYHLLAAHWHTPVTTGCLFCTICWLRIGTPTPVTTRRTCRTCMHPPH